MIRGRASSSGTFIGALSLAAVVSSLYLSPLGTSPTHKSAISAAASRVKSTSSGTAKRGAAKSTQKQSSSTTKGTASVKTVTRTLPGKVVKNVVYLPSSTAKPGGTTTTTSPPTPSRSTTTTTVPTFSTYTVPRKSALVAPKSDYWGVSSGGRACSQLIDAAPMTGAPHRDSGRGRPEVRVRSIVSV